MNFGKASRPVVMGRNGMVSSGHYLASLAGMRMLHDGGNAVDAALAASLALSVVTPETSGPGGDIFVLVYMKKTGKVEALNASGPAPKRATIEYFRAHGHAKIPSEGPLSIAVPGAVDGWTELHHRHGTLELPRIAADAIHYARDGFPISDHLSKRIGEFSKSFPLVDLNYRKVMGSVAPGRILVQKGLAQTLEQIAKKGRDAFYTGELTERMCAALKAEGAIIDREDLQGKFAEWMEPLRSTYRDFTVFEQPPVSQGFLVLEMLNLIESYPLERMEPAEVIHVMVEAKKLAFEDRLAHLDDPRFGDPQVARLISKAHAEKRRGAISDNAKPTVRAASAGGDTTYLCAADRDGNAITLIQSVFAPFGSRIIAGDTGVAMNNRLCSFGLDEKKANALRPGKRPAHTLNSYMVFRGGFFVAAGGTPGNDDQPQSNLQILHRLLDQGSDPQSAVEAPRWSHMPGTPPRDKLPEELRMEEGFPVEVMKGLEERGHKVKVVDRWSFGASQVIARDPATGALMGAADPRREGYAIGW
ncbi:MAG TPA: gamma-glutamyltransferase [Candidatus Binatia bacterium]|jgi:gamma-glutamyltranspeptidase/glutathione hydrolase